MKFDNEILILGGPDILELLKNREREIIEAVKLTYCEHHAGHTFLPHSVFVRFPGRTKERIIALPGYVGGDTEIAGIKWISSFPNNVQHGMSRASAIIVLNSLETGRPEVLLEGSLISAARTAASAALAGDVLHPKGDINVLGIVGCGLINREILRFLTSLKRRIGKVLIYDIDLDRAQNYRDSVASVLPDTPAETCASCEDVMAGASLISFATTAVEPTVADLSMCGPNTTVLHISLRDLLPRAILQADNVVDDVDHVMRAQTSVHLAEQEVGHRRFVRCTLADILVGDQQPRRDGHSPVVFSPFGLGVLDLAVAKRITEYALANGVGQRISGFFLNT